MFIFVFTMVVLFIGPILMKQVETLIDNTPQIVKEIQHQLDVLQKNTWFINLQNSGNLITTDITTYISDNMYDLLTAIGSNLLGIILFLTSILIILIIVPFVLFYLLKDQADFKKGILKFIPKKHREESDHILRDMDDAISSYVQGQIIVSFCVGLLALVAYLIIGLEYSLILALIAMVTNVIPVIGPFIGTFPAIIVGFLDSPLTALWVVIAILIVQQIESNFISPQVMGRQLDVHPLTVILLLLAASQIAGLIGLILAVPTYAILKVIAKHTYRLVKLRYDGPPNSNSG
jgi:predicted PurR-regulated permease PerM